MHAYLCDNKLLVNFYLFQLLEMNHRRLRQLEAKHSKELRDVQEQLSREEESVVAMREEGRLKEEQLAKLKKSLKDVRAYCIH